jgi:ribosomal protein L39E
MDFLARSLPARRLGKVVKSNAHCDYVVQVDDSHDVTSHRHRRTMASDSL